MPKDVNPEEIEVIQELRPSEELQEMIFEELRKLKIEEKETVWADKLAELANAEEHHVIYVMDKHPDFEKTVSQPFSYRIGYIKIKK